MAHVLFTVQPYCSSHNSLHFVFIESLYPPLSEGGLLCEARPNSVPRLGTGDTAQWIGALAVQAKGPEFESPAPG